MCSRLLFYINVPGTGLHGNGGLFLGLLLFPGMAVHDSVRVCVCVCVYMYVDLLVHNADWTVIVFQWCVNCFRLVREQNRSVRALLDLTRCT